ncbi:MAG: diguanylate cyclase, partial [Oleiphilaceae bacterium]|nr:diguanylate cyclase [Oleiphilaceae bacterium]
ITDARLDFPGPKIIYVNPAFTKMTGFTADELIGATPRILQGENTDPELMVQLRTALDAGQLWAGRAVNYRKDGTSYWVEWNISPVRGDSGKITHFVSVQRDITESVAERKQLEMLSSALEKSPDYILMADASGCIEYVNPAFEAYTGTYLEHIRGHNLQLLETDHSSANFYRNISKTLGQDESFRSTFVNRGKENHMSHIEQTITPVKNSDGDTLRYLSVSKDVTQRVQKEKELKRVAATDILTGLINRWSFDEVLREEIERTRRHGRPLSLIMVDIDHFKEVNDACGHDVGDDVLVQLCGILRVNLRVGDHFARWGGEEFMILTPETDLEQAKALANKLRETIKETPFPDVGTLTASFGVVHVRPGEPVKTLLKRVDRLLYEAKEQGRDRVIIADELDESKEPCQGL